MSIQFNGKSIGFHKLPNLSQNSACFVLEENKTYIYIIYNNMTNTGLHNLDKSM